MSSHKCLLKIIQTNNIRFIAELWDVWDNFAWPDWDLFRTLPIVKIMLGARFRFRSWTVSTLLISYNVNAGKPLRTKVYLEKLIYVQMCYFYNAQRISPDKVYHRNHLTVSLSTCYDKAITMYSIAPETFLYTCFTKHRQLR